MERRDGTGAVTAADHWTDQMMMFFLEKGYRVIAHDRRGHGRSTQTATGISPFRFSARRWPRQETTTRRGGPDIGLFRGAGT